MVGSERERGGWLAWASEAFGLSEGFVTKYCGLCSLYLLRLEFGPKGGIGFNRNIRKENGLRKTQPSTRTHKSRLATSGQIETWGLLNEGIFKEIPVTPGNMTPVSSRIPVHGLECGTPTPFR